MIRQMKQKCKDCGCGVVIAKSKSMKDLEFKCRIKEQDECYVDGKMYDEIEELLDFGYDMKNTTCDGGWKWWKFKLGTSKERMREILETYFGCETEGNDLPPSQYDCTGRLFSYPMKITVKRDRIDVSWMYCYDV